MHSFKRVFAWIPAIIINLAVIYVLWLNFSTQQKIFLLQAQKNIAVINEQLIQPHRLKDAVSINQINTALKKYGLRIVLLTAKRESFGIPKYQYLRAKKFRNGVYKYFFVMPTQGYQIYFENFQYKEQGKKLFTSFLISTLIILFLLNLFILNLMLSLHFLKRGKTFPVDIFGLNLYLSNVYKKILKENEELTKKNKVLSHELEEYKIREIKQKREFDIASFTKNIEVRLQKSEPTDSLFYTIMEGFCEYLTILEVALYLPKNEVEFELAHKYNYYGEDSFFPDILYLDRIPFGGRDYAIEEGLYILLKSSNDIPVGILYAREKINGMKFDIDDAYLASTITPKFITVIEKINSVTDGLTKLYNNRYFQQQIDKLFTTIKQSKRSSDTFSLIMTDIDHFKKFNDTYGHQVGDFVLQSIASLIKRSLREEDRAFRYGGEEMAILLPYTNEEGAYIVAERIRKRIEATKFTTPLAKDELHVTISLGVAEYQPSMRSPKELIRNADTALYKAKAGWPGKNIPGRNQTVKFSDISSG